MYIWKRMDANQRNELSGLQSNKDQAIYVYDKRSEIKRGANHQANTFPLGRKSQTRAYTWKKETPQPLAIKIE